MMMLARTALTERILMLVEGFTVKAH